jgi:hypothetical protein
MEKGRWKKGIWEEINGKIGVPGIPGRPKNNGKKIGKENAGKEDGGREDLEHERTRIHANLRPD